VRQALKAFTQMLRAGIPDVRFVAEEIIAEGDLVAAYWTAQGTHVSELMGVPGTGQPVSFSGLDMIRVVDGKCTDHWGFDNSMLRLGGGM
jgi:predicted ester cyclase